MHRECVDLVADHGWHFHPQCELTLFIRSTGVRYIGDRVSQYGPGDLVLSGPNLPHCWRNQVGDGMENAEWLTVQFDTGCLAGNLLDLPEAADIRRLPDDARWGLHFEKTESADAEILLRALGYSQALMKILKLVELLLFPTNTKYTRLATVGYHRNNVVDQALVKKLKIITAYINAHFRGCVILARIVVPSVPV